MRLVPAVSRRLSLARQSLNDVYECLETLERTAEVSELERRALVCELDMVAWQSAAPDERERRAIVARVLDLHADVVRTARTMAARPS